MTWGARPAQWRSARVRWLLDLTWYGHVFRFSDEPCTAPTGTLGATERYEGGLDVGDLDDVLGLFADRPQMRSVSMTVHMAGVVDVVAQIAAGWDLQCATGRLMLYPDGGAARDVIVVMDGVVREPEHETSTDPVTFSLAEDDDDAFGLIPAEREVYDENTWTAGTGDPDMIGERYPIIVGRPGGSGAYGSAALMVAANRLLIAGHQVEATTVTVYDETHVTSEVLAPSEIQDDEGQTVATLTGFVTIGSPAGTLVAGDPYWIQWNNGGGLGRASVEVRGAGQVLRWMLERAGCRWDTGRTLAAAELLDGFLIDAAVVAPPEERIRPLDWIRDHLSPILPMSLRNGPEGIYPVVWRWAATNKDILGVLDADAVHVVREGPVEYGSRSDVVNDISLRYRRNARTDRLLSKIRIVGDSKQAALFAQTRLHRWCEASVARYGVRAKDATTEVVVDEATAWAIVTWWARRYALPSRRVTYRVPLELIHLEPGSPVLVKDAAVGLSSRVGLVESIRLGTSGDLLLGVRVLDDPGVA